MSTSDAAPASTLLAHYADRITEYEESLRRLQGGTLRRVRLRRGLVIFEPDYSSAIDTLADRVGALLTDASDHEVASCMAHSSARVRRLAVGERGRRAAALRRDDGDAG